MEKEKKKSGGGGLALAMVYAAKLGCYFIVQVRCPAACCLLSHPTHIGLG